MKKVSWRAQVFREVIIVTLAISAMEVVVKALSDFDKFKEAIKEHSFVNIYDSLITSVLLSAIATLLYKLTSHIFLISEKIEENAQVLGVFDRALKIMNRSNKHSATINRLIKESVYENATSVPYCDLSKYLSFLISAIRDGNSYYGIERDTIGSFKSNSGSDLEFYLKTLKNKKMNKKVRVFIIKDSQCKKMIEELKDDNICKIYWDATGEDVETYWISESKFHNDYSNIKIPDDCGVYDEELKISYDDKRQVVQFNLLESNDDLRKIFSTIEDTKKMGEIGSFRRISPKQK